MFEDDLRIFPMATTGYLQKILATQRYQDIIAVDELFKAIVRVVQAAKTEFSKTDGKATFLEGNWLVGCRLTFAVWDLTHDMIWPGLIRGIVTMNNGNEVTPCLFSDRSTLIRLVRKLRSMPDYDCFDPLAEVCISTCGSFFVFTIVAGLS